jgi:hypothetical protein
LLEAFSSEGVEIPFPHRVIVSRPADATGTAADVGGAIDGES